MSSPPGRIDGSANPSRSQANPFPGLPRQITVTGPIRCYDRCIDGKYRRGRQGLKNENLYRTTEPASSHPPFSSLRPRAHVRVFACRRAAVDPETTRSLRTGCDAPLQSVYPGRSACLSLHVRLPALSQSRLPRRTLQRPKKEGEAPLRNPITGIAGCCARAASGHAAAAPPSSVMNSRRLVCRERSIVRADRG